MTPDERAALLLARQNEFRAFLISKLGNVADADDVLQNGLIKALRQAADVRDDSRIVAWFYQLLRHAIIDHVRSTRALAAREHAWSGLAAEGALAEEHQAMLCRCFEGLIGTLKPVYAELLRAVELEGSPVRDAAARLGITPNNASVMLHRARAELRTKLVAFCGACAGGACLDCDCGDAKKAGDAER